MTRAAPGVVPDAATDPVRLAEVVGALRAGLAPRDAWRGVDAGIDNDGLPLPDDGSDHMRAVRAACSLAHQAGAPLAPMLESVLDRLRVAERAQGARESELAGPQLSARVLLWLPVAGVAMGTLLDPGAFRVLTQTVLGWALMGVAGLLVWAGRSWMRALTSRARAQGTVTEASILLTLVDAALESGVDVRVALRHAGQAWGGNGLELVGVAAALGSQGWRDAWSTVPGDLEVVERALRGAWAWGASPHRTIAAIRDAADTAAQTASDRAIGELGVRLALPLTLCLLPAFVLVGLVPMLIAVAASVGLGA